MNPRIRLLVSALALVLMPLAMGCQTAPSPQLEAAAGLAWNGGGTGAGFLFGGAAGTVAGQRQDLESAGVPAALANRTTFDGTDGNVDSPSRIAEIAARVRCDAASGITANIALHAPGEGAAEDFKAWGSDQAWSDALVSLAQALSGIQQPNGHAQPIYVRYGKEFNQGWPSSCVAWLQAAATLHRRSCAAELFWQWNKVHDAFAAAPNVKLVWCPTGQLTPTVATSHPTAEVADELWPGADVVDVIGPDAYNGKRVSNETPASAFGDFVALAKAAGKPFLISETGIVAGGPDVDARWYDDLYAYLTGVEQHGVDVLAVAGFWRSTSFGDTTLTTDAGNQLSESPGFLHAQPARAQSCVAQ